MKKKCNLKMMTAVGLIASLILLSVSSARADDSDIFGANIEPNVMILFDNSTSMNNSILSSSYDPSTTYTTGTYVATKVYKIKNQDSFSVYAQTVDAVTSTVARTALNLGGYWTGQIGGSNVTLYTGNYLNWQACTTCDVDTPKVEIARQVVADIIKYVDNVRFGVMTFRAEGGQMVAPIGTDRATMIGLVNALLAPGGVGTPLGDQLFDSDLYFQGAAINGTTFADPIELECQPNFIIIISDGLHSKFTKDVRDVARDFLSLDHSSLDGTQSIILHTVGFNIAGATQKEIDARQVLKDAAANGGGTAFSANNAAELASSLQDAIRLIAGAVFTFATPVVPTTSSTGSNRAYVAAVQSDPDSVFWKGFLKAYDRDTDGTIRLNADGTPDSTYLAWEAGAVLNNKAAADRTIYVQTIPDPTVTLPEPAQRAQFTSARVKKEWLGVLTVAESDQIVDFIRGVDVFDEDGDANITENRTWVLGDIFHSTPVLVSQPQLAISDASYDSFKADPDVVSRPSIVIVGSNDGMLHAFRESDGEELWAWVPEYVLPNLKDLLAPSGEHPYFVDGSPIAADIKKADGTWMTIVMFGLRRGGTHYYALDITKDPATDSSYPKFLWSFNDSNLAETWSEPAIGKINWDGTDKYVAFFGGGYDTEENTHVGASFFAIDLETGEKLDDYYNDGSSDDRQYMNFSIPANPTAIDEDGDGYIDRVYIGDVGGQLWKFEPTVTPGTSTPTTYTYGFFDDNDKYWEKDFTLQLKDGKIDIDLQYPADVPKASPPASCTSTPVCYVYAWDGRDPDDEKHDYHLGYVGGLDDYGDETDFEDMVLVRTSGATSTSATLNLKGKRLFAADPSQANPPAVGEYYPAQAIYGAPSVALDDKGNLWVSFGTGDRNHPLNTSANRFYGIKDDTNMTNGNTLTESDLTEVASSSTGSTTVCGSDQGWYFKLEANEKVLAAADTFNSTVFFTTFTPDSTAVCGGGGGKARLYAVRLCSGFAAIDFDTNDAYAETDNYVGVKRYTEIGEGIPSKPAVMIDPNGNPSVITGTTSQQVSSVPAPPFSTKQFLGWREVF